LRVDSGSNTEDAGIGVHVVEACAIVDSVVSVQDIRV
jgi:hypothetical protein